jgi:hypothetical protein
MSISTGDVKETAKRVTLDAFFRYFSSKKDVTTSHILLGVMFPDESAIRSAIGGLETSLGTRLWEHLAKNLAAQNGFKVLNPKEELQRPADIPSELQSLIAAWGEKRQSFKPSPSIDDFREALDKLLPDLPQMKSFQQLNKGSGADLFLAKDGNEWAFDIKTVQINAGGGPKFNSTLLEWIAYRSIFEPNSGTRLKAKIVIPYDPTRGTWWKDYGGRVFPLVEEDIFFAADFWSFLGGREEVYGEIQEAFIELSDEHGLILRDCLLGMTEQSQLLLLQLARKLNPVDASVSWRKGRRLWKCIDCDSEFEATFDRIKKEDAICPNGCYIPVGEIGYEEEEDAPEPE